MEFKQIQELIKAINKSNISELTVKEGEFEITIKQAQTTETSFVAVQAPMHMPQMMQWYHYQVADDRYVLPQPIARQAFVCKCG
jgi:acetyl-CoA carboxylase biotin carboxyl carrier protein